MKTAEEFSIKLISERYKQKQDDPSKQLEIEV
jgi:hypothetical protein